MRIKALAFFFIFLAVGGLFLNFNQKISSKKHVSTYDPYSTVTAKNYHQSGNAISVPIRFQADSRQLMREIIVPIATHQKVLEVNDIYIKSLATSCVLRPSKRVIQDNERVAFKAINRCLVERDESLLLVVEGPSINLIAMWVGDKAGQLPLAVGSSEYLMGSAIIDSPISHPIVSRFEAYDYIWFGEVPSTQASVTLIMCLVSVVLFSVGMYLFVESKRKVGQIVALFVSTLSIATLFTFLVPPYMAPDEADHFITFVDHQGGGKHIAGSQDLAIRSCYSRIMCHTDEVFTVHNIVDKEPWNGWPNHVQRTQMHLRSFLGLAYWKMFKPLAMTVDTGSLFLMVRFANSLLIALSFILGYYLLGRYDNRGKVIVLSIMCIPTLSYFGMHVSNHVIVIGCYIAVSMSALNLWTDSHLGKKFILGGILTLGVLTSRSFWPFFATISVFCFIAIAFSRKAFLSNTIVVAIPLATLFSQSGWYIHYVGHFFQRAVETAGIEILTCSFIFLLLGLFCYRNMQFSRWSSHIRMGFVLSLLVLLVAPLVVRWEPIPNIEGAERYSSALYTLDTLMSFFLNSGFSGKDFLLIYSFWGGFSCPSRFYPEWVASFLQAGLFIIGNYGIFRIDTKKSSLALKKALLGSLVLILYLGMIAFSLSSLPQQYNLHGRYLIGFYLLLIISIIRCLSYNISATALRRSTYIMAVLALVLQISSLLIFGDRFFGA